MKEFQTKVIYVNITISCVTLVNNKATMNFSTKDHFIICDDFATIFHLRLIVNTGQLILSISYKIINRKVNLKHAKKNRLFSNIKTRV